MNPITQRPTTPAQQNGAGPQLKPTAQKATINQDMNAADRHANDRLIYLLGNIMVSYLTVLGFANADSILVTGPPNFSHDQEWRCILWNIFWRRHGEPRASLLIQDGSTSQIW